MVFSDNLTKSVDNLSFSKSMKSNIISLISGNESINSDEVRFLKVKTG